MIKRVGSLYTSLSLPGKFYLTRKEILSALEDEGLSELTDFSDFLEEENIRRRLALGANKLYEIAKSLGYRTPESEPIIAKDPEVALKYAHIVIGDRWPEAEGTISKHPYYAYLYTLKVININTPAGGTLERWPEAEETIVRNPFCAYYYAKNIINDRWPEGEAQIITDPETACNYAIHVIKNRWREAEPIIHTSNIFWHNYSSFLERKGIEIY